jgi:pilus assembly protein CpaE
VAGLIIVEPDRALAERLGARLSEHADVKWAAATEAGAALLEDRDLSVVVLGPGVPQDAALAFAQNMSAARPQVGMLLMAQEMSTGLLRLAMRHGVSDVVAFPGDTRELEAVVEVALQRSERLRQRGAVAEATHAATVLTVLSTKGGVGKSIVATNLAVSLAQLGKNTVLVDLDLRSGDLGIMLELKPTHTIADAAADSDHLDEDMLRGFFVDHPVGVHVLLAPAEAEQASIVSAPRLSRILDLLRGMCDVIIVDTPPVIDDCVLTAVDKSDLIYVIATMDVASVKDARYAIQRLRTLGYADGSVRLLLNRADSRVLLDPVEVERAIGLEISARIPSNRLVPRSVNKGVPVVLEAPRSAVARSLAEIARSVAAEGGASR